MFFRKKNKEDLNKKWYSIAIMSEKGLEDEEFDTLTEKILDKVDNVGLISNLVKEEWDQEQLKILEQKFNDLVLSSPTFTINEMVYEDMERETKLLEKKHKWKKFFGLISLAEYLEAENRAVYNFNYTLLYTDSMEEVIEFLNEKSKEIALVNFN
ncbi:hypothetical protein [Metabacillus fastidiosus]|uniref:hypothetical protein n=1 Tax=Metabacillus fastidiosus TaxID=1458 RepID=UPI002DBD5ACC|nr:hypothetical protein [Metabacillus fastidiosus]MEC2075053.1 hypothetical protein [Metabacillus fastidiosus]